MCKVLFVGLTTIDIQYFIDSFPASNVKVKSAAPSIIPGGPATNAAVAFSFLGGNATLVSTVGCSEWGSLIQKDFSKYQISHIDMNPNNEMPVLATVVTSQNNGDRNIFTFNPSDYNCNLQIEDIFKQESFDLVLTDGFYPQITSMVLKHARKHNIPTILDGGSWKPQLENLLSLIDIAICSETFAAPDCASQSDTANYMRQKGVEYVAFSMGEKPIRVFSKNSSQFNEIPVRSVNAVDTLGAGDFLHGAFAYYLAEGYDFSKALKLGADFSSETCKYQGSRKYFEIKLEEAALG
ncbi:hypothetical protein EYV94_13745 [Puteibacter caeruleilacunae]|nr:hypothetical protein EYV94_13745 [Puteibacter caeruleilacunae]